MIDFRKEAISEVSEAIDWYRQRSMQSAAKFNERLDKAIAGIEADPARYAKIHLDFRYILVFGFPYTVIFQIRSDYIMVLAIAHTSRRDKYWMDRG